MLPEGDPRKELVSEKLITYVTDRKGHDRRYAIAPDKIKADIGWYPETMFKEGIKKTIAWYQSELGKKWLAECIESEQAWLKENYENRE